MRWPWTVMLVGCAGLAGSAWSQRGPQHLPPIPLESLGPDSFDARSFDGLARRAGPRPADPLSPDRLPLPGGSAGSRAGSESPSYPYAASPYAAPPPWQGAEGYAGAAPYWGSPYPGAIPQVPGGWTGGGVPPPFPLLLPEWMPRPQGEGPAERRPAPERRPMFSQGWTRDGFGSQR